MPDFKILSLDVNGHAKSPLPNRFLKQIGESRALLVMLPGLNYSCDNPLFFYTTSICLSHSVDVLQLWANYNASAFQSLAEEDRLRWLVEDATALITAGRAQRDYTHLILDGKSISTLTLGALLGDSDAFLDAHVIWLTPLIRYPFVVRGMSRTRKKSLYIAGSADRTFDANLLAQVAGYQASRTLVIAGADHSMQIPGDLPRSLDAMKQIVAAVETFITSALADLTLSTLSRLTIALKALRQLGFTQVALNALYKFGLATGHYRRAIRPPLASHRSPSTVHGLFDLPSREQILQTIGQTGLQTLLAEADEIAEGGQFRQFGGGPVEISLVPPLPLRHWTEYETRPPDLRPFDELRASPATFDIKLTWEPARFGWAFTLGRAYHLTGDEKYAETFWRYLETFTAANPSYLGPNWMSAQEVGLRLMAFTWAGQVFAKAAATTPARLADIAVSTAVHAARIPATLPYARSQNNNHLLTEAAALYTAGLALPDHPQAAQWLKTGQKWLAWCFNHQIDAYGEYVQHSTNYHRLMLQTALWVWSVSGVKFQVSSKNLIPDTSPLAPLSHENLALATHWLLSLLDPESGQVPNLGANDGAYIFPLTSLPFADYRPVAQAAARAFLGYTLPPGPWDEMSLWFGLPQVETQLEIPRYPGEHLYAPNSWGYLRAVRFKSRPSHADQLHFDLWWRGLNIAQDAGTYFYNADPPWDNQLTSTLVHNTVSVDGLEQMTRASRFLYLDWADATSKRDAKIDADFLQRASARTYAYARVNVRHDRTVTVFNDERWLVEDELLNVTMPGQTPRAHVYRLHWLLPDWAWEVDNRGQVLDVRLKSPLGWVKLSISAGQSIKRVNLVRAGELIYSSQTSEVFETSEVSATHGWVSPTYSVKIPALSLAVEVQSADSIRFTSEFTFQTTDDRP